jgi:site-specific recombinase XerD
MERVAGERCADGDDSTAGDRTAGGGALVELHVTGPVRSAVPGADTAVVLRRAGVRPGQPFILGSGGEYDVQLNRFLRELDSWGVRAANSIAAYGRDVMLFCRFLDQARGGKSIWACDAEDLAAFKRARLHGPDAISVSTWRRSIAALDKWAKWAAAGGVIECEPFRYRDKTVATPHGLARVRVNTCSEPDPGPAPVEFISFEDYLLWRDVGLRGFLPNGNRDPSWRGRHYERNALFADLLIYTGMRLSEASSLLACELPADTQIGAIGVVAAVAKRNRARTAFMPARLVRSLQRYARLERDELITRIAADGGYRPCGGQLLARRAGRLSVTFADGGTASVSKLDPQARRALMLVNSEGELAGPAALWLGGDGQPLAPSAWQSVFARANARCARLGVELRIHPHTLRHSFAVHMLGLLLRQTVAALGEQHAAGSLTSAQAKRLLIGNPLRKLQLLLGHQNEATVYCYLDVLDEAQEIVASALEQWEVQAAGFAQLARFGQTGPSGPSGGGGQHPGSRAGVLVPVPGDGEAL